MGGRHNCVGALLGYCIATRSNEGKCKIRKEKRNGEFGHFGETAMGIENPLFIAANPTFGRWATTKGDEGKVSSSSTKEK